MTEQELNRLVAERIDGWLHVHQGIHSDTGTKMWEGWPPQLKSCCELPDYCNDANAVTGLLGRFSVNIRKNERGWTCLITEPVPDDGQLYSVSTLGKATAPTFPKAAVLALLKAHGVEVQG